MAGLQIDIDSRLLCPICGFHCTHLEHALISARGEDRVPNEIAVNGVTGRVETHRDRPSPTGGLGEGRRHRIALAGHCENGHQFAIVFTQHKGETFVEVADWKAPENPFADEADDEGIDY